MKILHTSDLHFNKRWFKWIEKQQFKYDIFCIAGDFLESSKNETLVEQIDWVSKWLREFEKPLFICSGNHDIEEFENENWLDKIPNIYSDNQIVTINGIKFGSIEYIAPEFYKFDSCEVILNHLPPSNTKTSIHKNSGDDWGDKQLRDAIQNGTIAPKIILSGHMHHPTSQIDKIENTTIYNTGVDKKSDIPNFLIIELDARE
ncbi:MAG: metallophosphoesterase [Sulfurimonas sp.]|nr:metallophosphoesterase [Sulfurimonas sp.]